MNVAFEASFARDLKHISDRQLLRRVQKPIEAIKAAASLNDLPDMKKSRI